MTETNAERSDQEAREGEDAAAAAANSGFETGPESLAVDPDTPGGDTARTILNGSPEAQDLREKIARRRSRERGKPVDHLGDALETGGVPAHVADPSGSDERIPVIDRETGAPPEPDEPSASEEAAARDETLPEDAAGNADDAGQPASDAEDGDPFVELEVNGEVRRLRRSAVEKILSAATSRPADTTPGQTGPEAEEEDDERAAREAQERKNTLDLIERIQTSDTEDAADALDELIANKLGASQEVVRKEVRNSLAQNDAVREVETAVEGFRSEYDDLVKDPQLTSVTFGNVNRELRADLLRIGMDQQWVSSAPYDALVQNYSHYVRDPAFAGQMRPLNEILTKAGNDTRAWVNTVAGNRQDNDPAEGQDLPTTPVKTEERARRRERLQPASRRAGSPAAPGASTEQTPRPKTRKEIAREVVAMRSRKGTIPIK